jgi:hypothetical protein
MSSLSPNSLETELAEIEASDIEAVNTWARESTVPHISTRD